MFIIIFIILLYIYIYIYIQYISIYFFFLFLSSCSLLFSPPDERLQANRWRRGSRCFTSSCFSPIDPVLWLSSWTIRARVALWDAEGGNFRGLWYDVRSLMLLDWGSLLRNVIQQGRKLQSFRRVVLISRSFSGAFTVCFAYSEWEGSLYMMCVWMAWWMGCVLNGPLWMSARDRLLSRDECLIT